MKLTTNNGSVLYGGYIPNPAGTDAFCELLLKCGYNPDGQQISKQVFYDEKKDMVLPIYLFKAMPNWQAGRQGIGDCMSFSCSHNIDVLASVQAYLQQTSEDVLYPVCSEAMYGFMRVEVFGKPDYGGDGAYGGAAAKAVMKYGTLHRKKYNLGKGYDFTTYSGSRAKEFGRTGVPDELEEIAREHIVKTATLVKDFETAAKFIMNGYPISNAHSSNPTFQGKRDKDGYGVGTGYSHAMNYIGVRWGEKPALLKTNTGWADTVTGPIWPDQLNGNPSLTACAWWEEADICDKVLSGDDSFAYSQYNGFKKQSLPDYGTSEYL